MMTFVVTAVLAQVGARDLIEQAERQLERHQDVEARRTLERAKEAAADEPALLARVYLTLGLAHAAAADERRAIDAFKAALKLDKGLRLARGAPKVVEWWRAAGGAVEVKPLEPASAPVAVPTAARPLDSAVAPVPTVGAPEAALPRRPWWLIPAGVGAITGVGAVITLVSAEQNYRRLVDSPSLDPSFADRLATEGSILRATGLGLGITAALALVAAFIVGAWP